VRDHHPQHGEDNTLDLGHIIGQTGDQGSGLKVVQIIKGKGLRFPEEGGPEVGAEFWEAMLEKKVQPMPPTIPVADSNHEPPVRRI